jgi:hypothetical protein
MITCKIGEVGGNLLARKMLFQQLELFVRDMPADDIIVVCELLLQRKVCNEIARLIFSMLFLANSPQTTTAIQKLYYQI